METAMTTENAGPSGRSFTGGDARRLLREANTASLGTLNRDDGGPYVSVVNMATDPMGWPIVLISRLAWHTLNIMAHPKASILAAELPASGDVLTGSRVSVMGTFEPGDPRSLRHRYLSRHPEAGAYIDFGDFSFWRLRPERIHAVAGFGRIETMPADEVFPAVPDWNEIEESAIIHMNDDHRGAVQLYAQRLLGAEGTDWKITAIDPDGCDLAGVSGTLRLAFPAMVRNGKELREAFVALSKQTRGDVNTS
jgi:hypothetical protein